MTYIDNNATTRVAREVFEAMLPYLGEQFANPSSSHRAGQEAKRVLDRSRETVAGFVRARSDSEIIFTSGGTESNNWAIRGAAKSAGKRRRVVTTRVEHPSVLNTCRDLEKEGFPVTYLDVDEAGALNREALRRALGGDVLLVSIMHANNETGVVFPVEKIAQEVKACGAYFHVDAVQSLGKLPVALDAGLIDFASFAGHKIHGPKGIGVLYARKGAPLASLMSGGSQERGRRPGTENVPAIAGMARACELAAGGMEARNRNMMALRDRLEKEILATLEGVRVNGAGERLPNTSSLSFDGVDAEALLIALSEEGIYASSGSACASGSTELSHVLLAMGLGEARAKSTVRFSLGRYNTDEDVDMTVRKTAELVSRLRQLTAGGV